MRHEAESSAEWAPLTALWQAREEQPPVDPQALRAHVDAESRRMRWWVVVEVCLTIAVLGVTTWNLVRHPGVRALLMAADVGAVLAIVWAFALWGRRGIWRPSADSTEAYLVLARRRARLRLQTTWLALSLLVAQLAIVRLAPPSSPGATDWSLRAAATAAWLAWALWARRRALADIRRLDGITAELARQ
jgi:hypothetical protein